MNSLEDFGWKSKENIKKAWDIIEYRIANPIENPYPNDEHEADAGKQVVHVLGGDVDDMRFEVFHAVLQNLEDVYEGFEIEKVHDYVNEPAPDAYKHESPHQGLEPSFAVLQLPENIEFLTNDIHELFDGFDTNQSSDKKSVVIDSKNGIYHQGSPDRNYSLQYGTKRYKMVTKLCKSDRLSAEQLKEVRNNSDVTDQLISQEIRKINENFKGNLGFENNLIKSLSPGYQLDRDNFRIDLRE
jgi:hypothetical protein